MLLVRESPPAATLEGLLRGLANEGTRTADPRRLELLYKLFLATRNPRLRRATYRRIRKADDHAWTYQRRIAKQLFDIEIGKYSYGCYHLDWTIAPGSRIGAFCSVGLGVVLGRPQHAMEPLSTHPFLQLPKFGFVEKPDWDVFVRDSAPVFVGDDVWFGDAARVRGGVTIGKGAVIAQGAVVTKDVAPYAIVGGVPARQIRMRFPEPIVERLLRIDWASWDDATIRARVADFYDIESFVEKYDVGAVPATA